MVAPIGCGVFRSPRILPDVIGNEFGDVLDRAQRGDESAVACLWYDINPTLKRYLRVIAGEVNEDVVSRTWGVVRRGLTCFRGDEIAWRSWVFATARRAEPVAFARQSVLARQTPDPDISR
jgi:RNA polymerase sigma-70 factor (ECF subfamily)